MSSILACQVYPAESGGNVLQASLKENDVEAGLGHQDSAMAIQAPKADNSVQAHGGDSREGKVTH